MHHIDHELPHESNSNLDTVQFQAASIVLSIKKPVEARMAWTAWLCTKTWEQQPAVCG